MTMRHHRLTLLPLLLAASVLHGCALFHDHNVKTDSMRTAEARVPEKWQAPLPHDGKLADLKQWWSQFDDPLLAELIEAAQKVSPSLASARSRIEQARATAVAAGAALGPKLDLTGSASRGQADIRFPLGTSTSGGLSTSWELDLFGSNSAASDAADARLASARAEWHAARVSIAAETANSYIALRACEAQLTQAQIDAGSRRRSARLTDINREAGLESPANAALAKASAAQGNNLLSQQRALCEVQVKTLVALTAIDESSLRQKLAAGTGGRIPQPSHIGVGEVPAAALAQRPDLYSAAQNVMAANAEVTQLQAQRYPRISLTGNIGRGRFETSSSVSSGPTWSFGPVSLILPLYDGGVRRANVDAGRARYDEAASQYAAKLRTAIREVEEALINLDSTAERQKDAETAVDGFSASFRAVESRHEHGMANVFELEDARRSMINAKTALITLQRERVTAWISLYRALGGGWDMQEQLAAMTTTNSN